MSEFDPSASPTSGKPETIVQLRPTLYIGLGGTGMEVILRIRRRILGAVWRSTSGNPVRLDSLSDFPVAQFIHFDLDQGAVVETGKAQASDPLAERVKLADDDKLVESFALERYCKSDDDLGKYPHIESWFPLPPKKIRELAIDPAKGAGQIRAISRLYFFDKYPKTKDKIRNKLSWLKAGLSRDKQLKDLGLELDASKFRIVVLGSVAGGTGAGSFLDMGWLAQCVAQETVNVAEVELFMFLPTGYQSANKERTEANGYASLMELETCMQVRDGARPDYVERWEALERLDLSPFPRPYHEIYLIDSGNLAWTGVESRDLSQVYDMVADTLFEDFASVDFANRKRSVAVNQRQHKTLAFSPPVPGNRYGDMKLSYRQSYSSFGQAMLDTQQNLWRDIRAYHCVQGMIRAFFGLSAGGGGNRAIDKQRDTFMAECLYLEPKPFTDLPEFSARGVKVNRGEFTDYRLTDELLADRRGGLVEGIQQTVAARIENIAASFTHGEWDGHIRELLRQLEHDVVRGPDSSADTADDRIAHRAKEIFKQITERLQGQIYLYLDDKEHGGLEYVQSLVEQVKDRLEHPHTGVVANLAAHAKRYAELRDALRTHECEQLLANLAQTKGLSLALLGDKENQARLVLDQIKLTMGDYFKFHVRAKAAEQASRLLGEISQWLAVRQGVGEHGEVQWKGLMGELQKGRGQVQALLGSVNRKIELLEENTRKDHRTHILIETPQQEMVLPAAKELRQWAEEAFKDAGKSRRLFSLLADAGERERHIGLLRKRAEQQLDLLGQDQQPGSKDPLVVALEAMDETQRKQRFKELLTRAMPWFEASWGRDFTPRADQFKCYIGVGDPADYEDFQDELLAQLPPNLGITPQQVAFVKTGVPGRAVCYCELSGFPLTILKGMESWRASYRKESEKIPLHNHRDPTRFIHPLVPSTATLNQLADDFHQYLLAVMLGVLFRDGNLKLSPPGQYRFSVSRGEDLCMGNERAFRLNGLPPQYSRQISEAVAERLDGLAAPQLSALAGLADHYANEVYAPRLVPDEHGIQNTVKGFPAAIAEQVAAALDNRARRKGAAEEERQRWKQLAEDKLMAWTQEIKHSEADAYAWEIKEPKEDQPRCKRMVRKEFFQTGWLEQTLQAQPSAPTAPGTAQGVAPPPPPGFGSAPPPPPPPQAFFYHLAIGGQQYGPYARSVLQGYLAEGRADAATLGWREGLAQWLPLAQIPELAGLFAAAPPPPPGNVPPPPPLPEKG